MLSSPPFDSSLYIVYIFDFIAHEDFELWDDHEFYTELEALLKKI